MRTDAELRQLALDIVDNRVFGTFHLREGEDAGMVFMTLMFMDAEGLKRMRDDEVVHLYEEYSKAGPRSVNGLPGFFSHHEIRKAEWDKLFPLILQLEEQRKAFLSAPVESA